MSFCCFNAQKFNKMIDTQVLLASHHLNIQSKDTFSALQRQIFLYRIISAIFIGLNSTVKHMNLYSFENPYYHDC